MKRALPLIAYNRSIAAALIACGLSACAPEVRFVPIPCVSKDQLLPPAPPKIADKLTGRADEDLRIVSGSALRLRAWGEGLLGIAEGCRAK